MNASDEVICCSDGLKVVAILVNWRQPKRTLAAVDAIQRQSHSPRIIVVDNGSADDSVNFLRHELPADVRLVCREVNDGFGVGVNAGLEEAESLGADYVWLVNNDAIPERTCLEYMVRVARGAPVVGAVGARISDPDGLIPDHAGTVMDGLTLNCRYSLSDHDMNRARYAWITGACMLLNMEAVRRVGTFDPGFFMYWEDADLCSRLRRCGYRLEVAKDAIIYHSAGTSSDGMRFKRFEWHIESQNRWVKKNYQVRFWGLSVIFLRHAIKSLVSSDWGRLRMTMRRYIDRALQYLKA